MYETCDDLCDAARRRELGPGDVVYLPSVAFRALGTMGQSELLQLLYMNGTKLILTEAWTGRIVRRRRSSLV